MIHSINMNDDLFRVDTRRGLQGDWQEDRMRGDLETCVKYFNGLGLGQVGQKRVVRLEQEAIDMLACVTRHEDGGHSIDVEFSGHLPCMIGESTAKLITKGVDLEVHLDDAAAKAREDTTMRSAMGLKGATSAELSDGVVEVDEPDALGVIEDDADDFEIEEIED